MVLWKTVKSYVLTTIGLWLKQVNSSASCEFQLELLLV